MIGDSYACRAGLGTHRALQRATSWARRYRWFVHLDIRKYFASIDHAVLFGQLERDLACQRTLEVCKAIVSSTAAIGGGTHFHMPGDDLFTPQARATGIPIGYLTSQHFANRYLSPVDHRAKDRLRFRGYLRYMDDMLLFANDRGALADAATDLEQRCWGLRLRVHPWHIRPCRAGVSFVGYRILPDEIRVRRSTVGRAERRLREKLDAARRDPTAWPAFLDSLRATFAHWAYAESWQLRRRTLLRLGVLEEEGKVQNMK